jgi:hypothetical protein
MKKVSFVIFLLLMILYGCGGTKFYFFGVDADIFKEAKGKDWAKVGVGVVTSMATHVGGHWVAGEIFDVDFKFRDCYTKEEIDGECWNGGCSDSDLRWFARGGFVLQHGVGFALTSFETTRYSYFTKGYVATSAIGTWSYPLRHYGSDYNDLKMLDEHGGNGDLEYAIYSTIALHNVLRVPWYKTEEGK